MTDATPTTLTLDQALTLALHWQQQDELDAAEALYQRILATVPDQPQALHFLGVLQHQRGQSPAAVALLERAIAVQPDYAEAHNNLGNIHKQQGQPAAAEAAYRQALALRPDFAEAHNNLGTVLKQQGDFEGAIAAYRQALALQPDYAAAYTNLGNVYLQLKQPEQAVAAYRQALALAPVNADAYQQLADGFYRCGAFREAAYTYHTAAELAPDRRYLQQNLGHSLYRDGAYAEAATAFRDCLRQDAANPVARHMLAACSGQDVPDRADDRYIQHIFDQNADRYDHHMRQQLDYQAPELIAAQVATLYGTPTAQLDILDCGCGTGLCGVHLRPYARQLTGVDLSTGMLRKARARGLYDDLIQAELTTFLSERPGSYDLIVACDTLNYFGVLEPVWRGATSALRPGGTLLCTVEALDQSGFRINPHGRYSHSAAYLQTTLAAAGLTGVTLLSVNLRQEGGRPVAGLLVQAQRPLLSNPVPDS